MLRFKHLEAGVTPLWVGQNGPIDLIRVDAVDLANSKAEYQFMRGRAWTPEDCAIFLSNSLTGEEYKTALAHEAIHYVQHMYSGVQGLSPIGMKVNPVWEKKMTPYLLSLGYSASQLPYELEAWYYQANSEWQTLAILILTGQEDRSAAVRWCRSKRI